MTTVGISEIIILRKAFAKLTFIFERVNVSIELRVLIEVVWGSISNKYAIDVY
jgi:hypothetical protein